MKRILISVLALAAATVFCRAQDFDIDTYIDDALKAAGVSAVGERPASREGTAAGKKSATGELDSKPFNDKYLTCRRGTSVVNKPHWLFPDDVYYGDNSATANLLALNLGLVPEDCHEEVLKNLVTDLIRIKGGHFVGDDRVLGILLPTLSAEGRSDVANLLSIRDSAILAPFIPQWRRTVLAGIPQVGEGETLRLEADFSIACLEDVDESAETTCGTVVSRWHKDLMHADWYVSVPEGVKAEVVIKASSRKQVRHGRGARFAGMEDGCQIWRLKGGEQHFDIDFDLPEHIADQRFLFEKHDFPTCHSSSITQLKNGDLLAVFTGGQNEAAADTRVYLTRKAKGAADWEPIREMTRSSLAETSEYSTYNPVIYQHPDGEVMLFYHTSESGKPCYLMRSADAGQSWSEAERLPDGIKGPERAQPLKLGDRLICPGDVGRPYVIRPLFSMTEDGGKTWTAVGPSSAEYSIASNNRKPGRVGENFDVPADNVPRERAFEILASIQPAVLVHRNGLLQALTRTCHGKLGCVWSYDGGKTWGHEYLTDIPNNNSGFTAITLRDGRFAMVFNDFESLPGAPRWEHMNARTPLTLAISEDGIKWTKVMDIETGPIHNNAFPSGYCYPNMIEGDDGCLHLVYTWQRRRIKYVKIKL